MRAVDIDVTQGKPLTMTTKSGNTVDMRPILAGAVAEIAGLKVKSGRETTLAVEEAVTFVTTEYGYAMKDVAASATEHGDQWIKSAIITLEDNGRLDRKTVTLIVADTV